MLASSVVMFFYKIDAKTKKLMREELALRRAAENGDDVDNGNANGGNGDDCGSDGADGEGVVNSEATDSLEIDGDSEADSNAVEQAAMLGVNDVSGTEVLARAEAAEDITEQKVNKE